MHRTLENFQFGRENALKISDVTRDKLTEERNVATLVIDLFCSVQSARLQQMCQ